ncbi:phosphoribosylglycinamide formyltransferase, chloroplastic-like [Selaginella moellendorffii]|uniref:phosphoribosylglycinamide formyltransferase, chloroplastic-like n=1 Tax=Selaginella moellendorffii TaxID=88036 RepID=UPI000D1CE3CF|nr:phosphoribosylglycinamide formyltransferase, chloroplastic-like [Selaginella moellendorffii]|eukprot:XP_024525822.1 phosphoribosylglycinamide formyltransferase, chloroplastic-like [Selaginella moellendorffii]
MRRKPGIRRRIKLSEHPQSDDRFSRMHGLRGRSRARDFPGDYPRTKFAPDGVSPNKLVEILRHQGVDFVLHPQHSPRAPPGIWRQRFLRNQVHEAAGARVSSATIHVVDENGSILAQREVPVLETDTPQDLAARVLEQVRGLIVL